MTEKEHYSQKLAREKQELVEAIKCVVKFHRALDRLQYAPYKGDARREVETVKAEWNTILGKIKPYLEEQ